MTANAHDSAIRAQRFSKHVLELCAAFDVAVNINTRMAPHAAGAGVVRGTTRKAIMISPVTDETTYAVALHELGHTQAPMGMMPNSEFSPSMRKDRSNPSNVRDLMLLLIEEEAAWAWAHHYALEWTPLMTQIEEMSIGCYRSGIKRIVGHIPDRW